MGREHRIIAGAAGLRRAGAAGARLLRRPGRQRRAVLRDGLRRRHRRRATAPIAEQSLTPAARERAQPLARRHDGRHPRRRPRRRRTRRPGQHEDYIARQLKRWYGQWNLQKTRELPLVDEVHDALAGSIPPQGPATIVHGDYRLDNTMVSAGGDVLAVLDWEICTLGDPLADVGLLQVYWTGPDDAAERVGGAVDHAHRVLEPRPARRALRRGVRPRRRRPRLLRRLRVLEAGLHARRRVRPLPRRRARRARPRRAAGVQGPGRRGAAMAARRLEVAT